VGKYLKLARKAAVTVKEADMAKVVSIDSSRAKSMAQEDALPPSAIEIPKESRRRASHKAATKATEATNGGLVDWLFDYPWAGVGTGLALWFAAIYGVVSISRPRSLPNTASLDREEDSSPASSPADQEAVEQLKAQLAEAQRTIQSQRRAMEDDQRVVHWGQANAVDIGALAANAASKRDRRTKGRK
jgi:hypothetical protein